MTPIEKIKEIAGFFLRLQRENPSARYVAFEDIRSITGVKNNEARNICDLLKAKGLMNFEYFPLGDTPAVFISLDKDESSYTHPKGAIRFFAMSIDENPSLRGIDEDLNFEALEEVVSSEKLRSELARELRPEVRYDIETSELVSGEKRIHVGPHNSKEIAELVFSKPLGTRIPELDVASKLDDTKVMGEFQNGSRAGYTYLYNAINRVNDKIEELTDIHHLIQYKKGKIWIE